jgi:S-adenosylmethionine:tRNA ribosyltransferase-isomerase
MKTDSLNYELPEKLIAQQPAAVRSESRLLVLNRNTGQIIDTTFNNIAEYLKTGDCLVINDTKVLQARFFARRKTGANLEGLFMQQRDSNQWLVMLKGAGKVKLNESIILKSTSGDDFCNAILTEKLESGQCLLKVESGLPLEDVLEHIGFAPLPPYIKRKNDIDQNLIDRKRYQTVYARSGAAVAAPTAGLHFTDELIEQLKQKGIDFARVTLDVSAGTFKPVTTETLEEHQMHFERFEIDEKNTRIINNAKLQNRRVIAVGTTSVRVLESVADNSKVFACKDKTDLFIKEDYNFKIVDVMVTNFHLPRSTLIALVGAFAGLDNILNAYAHAVKERYRFYSYGDAMLII